MDAALLWSGSTQKVREAARIPSIGREGESGGKEFGTTYPLPVVPLVAPVLKGSNLIVDCGEGVRSSRRLVVGGALEFASCKAEQQQATRKARRCWSRELHRKFESALEQLGGPDVATPKQIREVMKVEGLTNDEVKSHLQKYRIHSKKMSPAVKLDLHLKTSPVHSPNSPLEFSQF